MTENVRFFRYISGKPIEEGEFLGMEQLNYIPMKPDRVELRKEVFVDAKPHKRIIAGEVYCRKFVSGQGWYIALWGVQINESEITPSRPI